MFVAAPGPDCIPCPRAQDQHYTPTHTEVLFIARCADDYTWPETDRHAMKVQRPENASIVACVLTLHHTTANLMGLACRKLASGILLELTMLHTGMLEVGMQPVDAMQVACL